MANVAKRKDGAGNVVGWGVVWRVNGERKFETCPDEAEAKRRADLYATTREGRAVKAERTAPQKALDRFLDSRNRETTREFYRWHVGKFMDATKRGMATWDRHDLAEYVASNKGWSPNTVRKAAVALRTFARWCADQRVPVACGDPTIGFDLPKRVRRKTRVVWTKEQRDAILRAARERQDDGGAAIYLPLMLAFHAGLDYPDIEALAWEHIDTSGKVWRLMLPRHKTGVARDIPISDELRAALESVRATHGPVVRDAPSYSTAYVAFRRIQAFVGIPENVRDGFKACRRTYGTTLSRAGARRAVLQECMGHAEGSRETDAYDQATADEKVAAITKASKAAGA